MFLISSRARSGVSEVISSLSIFVLTMAVLGAIGGFALSSIGGAGHLVAQDSQDSARASGLMLSVVAIQVNTSGSYAWIFNYGWQDGGITDVYLDGGRILQWSSTCSAIKPQKMCAVALAPDTHGEVIVSFGKKKTLAFTV